MGLGLGLWSGLRLSIRPGLRWSGLSLKVLVWAYGLGLRLGLWSALWLRRKVNCLGLGLGA